MHPSANRAGAFPGVDLQQHVGSVDVDESALWNVLSDQVPSARRDDPVPRCSQIEYGTSDLSQQGGVVNLKNSCCPMCENFAGDRRHGAVHDRADRPVGFRTEDESSAPIRRNKIGRDRPYQIRRPARERVGFFREAAGKNETDEAWHSCRRHPNREWARKRLAQKCERSICGQRRSHQILELSVAEAPINRVGHYARFNRGRELADKRTEQRSGPIESGQQNEGRHGRRSQRRAMPIAGCVPSSSPRSCRSP
jgi:hypothetical protein